MSLLKPGTTVVLDKTLIVTVVGALPSGGVIVETGSGSMVVAAERLSLEREEVDA